MPSGDAAAQPSPQLSGTVAGRFRVLTRLGGGGMGEVYCAEDTTLKRRVALKRVAPALRNDPQQVQHMIKEAERASALNHPCVAAIYDVLQDSGEFLLVMEYVDGVALRQHMAEKMPASEALRIVEECAGALEAAHTQGIVHGDVKPDNIMITASGHVKLLDFGVARRIVKHPEQAETTTRIDPTGGTPGYMAPEVLLEKPVDGRSDLFSLGVVLYEALTGVHPFHATTSVGTVDRTLHEDPPSVHEIDATLAKPLAAVVHQLLEKDPADRYPTAGELIADLHAYAAGERVAAPAPHRRRKLVVSRAAAAGAVALFLLVAVAVGFWMLSRGTPAKPEVVTLTNRYVAVLPLEAASQTEEERVFANGITALLTVSLTQLAATQPLQVASANEIRDGHIADPKQAWQKQGVNLALLGRVESSPSEVRVAYRLVEAQSARELTQGTLVASASDPFALIEKLPVLVAQSLGLALSAAEQGALAKHGTADRQAFLDYVRGEGYRYQESPQDTEQAIRAFTRAKDRDPQFAPAYVSLGLAYQKAFAASKNAADQEAARRECARATEIAPTQAGGYLCLGTLDMAQRKYEDAVLDYRQALLADPQSDAAYNQLGRAYERLHNSDEAEHNYRRAVEVRPNSWMRHAALGNFYVGIGRYPDAVREFEQAVKLAPDRGESYQRLGGAHIYLGEYDAAIAALNQGVGIQPTPGQYSNLGMAYLYLRQYDQAVANLEQGARMASGDYILTGNLARAYYWAGKREEAKRRYQQAVGLAEDAARANPASPDPHILLADFYAGLDDRASAFRHLEIARALSADDPELWFFTAIVENRFHDRAGALKALEHAVVLGYSRNEISAAPEFDGLRDNPTFKALVRSR